MFSRGVGFWYFLVCFGVFSGYFGVLWGTVSCVVRDFGVFGLLCCVVRFLGFPGGVLWIRVFFVWFRVFGFCVL